MGVKRSSGVTLGQSRKRIGRDSKPRYTAYYDDIRGMRRSAGTFPTRRAADQAWQRAEAKVAEGRAADPARGKQTFRRYVETEWLPNHVMEASTREGYHYSIYAHIMDVFGPMRMIDILPSHVRDWVTSLVAQQLSPGTIRLNKSILSAIFTTALNDQVTVLHPCKGVKTPPVPRRPLRIITPEEFDRFHACLPDDARLMVETEIESGLRWGELSELRPRDLDIPNRLLTISRAVVELTAGHHPDGGRFMVKDYPKDREWRRLRLGDAVVAALDQNIRQRHLGPDDLLFIYAARPPHRQTVEDDEQSEDPLTEPNEQGRRYRHGTLSGYSAGQCRCTRCRRAYADYRAIRRAAGRDHPRTPRTWTTDGHIPRRWFRDAIIKPALDRAGLDIHLTMKALRHAHASWLLAGGADLQVVKERLGHGSISTTERYLHTLPDADDTALTALGKVRNGRARPDDHRALHQPGIGVVLTSTGVKKPSLAT